MTHEPVSPEPRARLAPLGWTVFAAFLLCVLLTRVVGPAPTALVLMAAAQPLIGAATVVLNALLALPAWGGQRAWKPLAAAALLWCAIWGRAWVPWRTEGEGAPIRVLSWNVQRLGFSDSAGSNDFRCVADAVRDMAPDVLALQEVSRRDVSRLSSRLELACEHTEYKGRNASGRGGVAVCVRGDAWRLGDHGARPYLEGRSWYFPWAEAVHADGTVVNVVGVHLQPYGKALRTGTEGVADVQADETEALLRRVRAMKDPTIVAGDFNSVRDSAVHGAMRSVLVDAHEQGAWGPGATVRALGVIPLRVDFVYLTSHFDVAGTEIPAYDCADHRPLLSRVHAARSRGAADGAAVRR